MLRLVSYLTHLVCLKKFLSELKSSFSSSLDVKLVLELSPKKGKETKGKKKRKERKIKRKEKGKKEKSRKK